MAATYCTTAQVAAHIGRTSDFSSSTVPTVTRVSEVIEGIERRIDLETDFSWLSTGGSLLDYEYHNIFRHDVGTFWQEGVRVQLAHRNVLTLTTASGDYLELWDGANWQSWLTTKTEGRSADYFLDYQQGDLFLIPWPPRWGRRMLRIKYRWGTTTVDKLVRETTIMMAAIEVLNMEGHTENIPSFEAQGSPTIGDRIANWQSMVDANLRILRKRYQTRGFLS